ncbi:MAG TPA: hypothetical protein DEH78_00770 [Solibacterales bacterium]|nr:hypothetical protein [Bryobacterales bacterium]
MFRSLSGFTAEYEGLTLVVVSEMDEWKVMAHGPGVVIHGGRQFSEEKAKQHALELANAYLVEEKQAAPGGTPAWTPTSGHNWLIWRR